ncbi:MAG: cation:proton antiporter [bacterium]|nr:cation:proton antiporter [bacterium]
MESYLIFKDLAIIIIFAKVCGLIARKLHAPQVVGEIIAGLLVGPSLFGLVEQTDFLMQMAEIGVVLLMFSAGLGTNLKELLKTGPIALAIACAGVFVPMIGGYFLFSCFYGFGAVGSEAFLRALFSGVILTATSVSITVQALRELGHLKGRVGTTILSAAIIDDVIGIIVLTFVIGMKNPESNSVEVVINTVLFFLIGGVLGCILYRIFRKLDQRYPHRRRIPILSLSLCMALAYCAERYFGIADITGAYVAGVILCSLEDSDYVAEKMDISSYMLFGPVFFASIGLKTDISGFTLSMLGFSIGFVLVGLIMKIVGCGLMAKVFRFSNADALKIGVGMMTRGEVALIVSQKGLSAGLMEPIFFTPVIFLIVVSSIMTPIVLKILYSRDPKET